MPRIKSGPASHQRRKRVLKAVKGYRGARGRHLRLAKEAILRAGAYAYRDRRARKRDFRALWITRVSAACGQRNIQYSRLIDGLKKAAITINRKMLSEIAIADPAGFDAIVATAKVVGAKSAA